jgi:hypothetical protein
MALPTRKIKTVHLHPGIVQFLKFFQFACEREDKGPLLYHPLMHRAKAACNPLPEAVIWSQKTTNSLFSEPNDCTQLTGGKT